MKRYEELRQGESGAWLSIIAYIFLSALKLVIGYLFFSQALVADGFNNASDIIISIAVLIGLRISQKPPDHDHPYGHFRAEHIAALFAAVLMAAIGIQVLIEASSSLLNPEAIVAPSLVAAWVAIFSSIIMLLVYRYNQKLATRINSQALMAAAKDNKADALVSLGACIGIIAAHFRLGWIDSITAFVIGLLICYTAWTIFRDATHALTDGFDDSSLSAYKKTIADLEHVQSLKTMKARQVGSAIHADVTIEVKSTLTVKDSHEIADEIESLLSQKHGIDHTSVHIEPEDE
ncbi:cation diffusion facilitator family transporter [Bacillus sp. FSL W7-1360]